MQPRNAMAIQGRDKVELAYACLCLEAGWVVFRWHDKESNLAKAVELQRMAKEQKRSAY